MCCNSVAKVSIGLIHNVDVWRQKFFFGLIGWVSVWFPISFFEVPAVLVRLAIISKAVIRF